VAADSCLTLEDCQRQEVRPLSYLQRIRGKGTENHLAGSGRAVAVQAPLRAAIGHLPSPVIQAFRALQGEGVDRPETVEQRLVHLALEEAGMVACQADQEVGIRLRDCLAAQNRTVAAVAAGQDELASFSPQVYRNGGHGNIRGNPKPAGGSGNPGCPGKPPGIIPGIIPGIGMVWPSAAYELVIESITDCAFS
jgi:hypothetical protein